MRVYVASSWRNSYQPQAVRLLRSCGHEVYDFRNPPGRTGFAWSQLEAATGYKHGDMVAAETMTAMLADPVAVAGYSSDIAALSKCDVCVLVLPSGRSASFEFGWAMARGSKGVVWMPEPCEPELMYLGATFVGDILDLPAAVEGRAVRS